MRHYNSIFPGHFLDSVDLTENAEEFTSIKNNFLLLINNASTSERDVLRFIKSQTAWFLIGSILKEGYSFGHHGVWLFNEFPLGNEYKADYLLVGRNSDGYHFVFVELESVYGSITMKNGAFGDCIRKGLFQIESWQRFLDSSFPSLRSTFEKALRNDSLNNSLDKDFTVFDSTKVSFAVICGRREDFNDTTRRLRRKQKLTGIEILHYDNLIDRATLAIGSHTY